MKLDPGAVHALTSQIESNIHKYISYLPAKEDVTPALFLRSARCCNLQCTGLPRRYGLEHTMEVDFKGVLKKKNASLE